MPPSMTHNEAGIASQFVFVGLGSEKGK